MKHAIRHLGAVSAGVLALAMLATPALAQTRPQADDQDSGLSDIVVTAQKRPENLQRVPTAVTAFTGDELQREGVTRVDEIATRVPNLFIASGNSFGTTRLNIRGVFSEPNNVGLANAIPNYVDGVAQGPGRSLNTALYDVAAIEVLRGPQGTLFGRNSTGGTILIRTNQPQLGKVEGYGEAEYGNYNRLRGEGAINVPLGDRVALRLAGTIGERDGYTYNTLLQKDQNDLRSVSLRGQMLFSLSDAVQVTLRVDHSNDRTDGNVKDFGPNASGGRLFAGARDFVVSSDAPVSTRRNMTSGSAEIDWNAGPFKIISLSSLGNFIYYNLDDVDFTSANVLATIVRIRQHQFSQELRIESPDTGPFTYVAGLYYFDETVRSVNEAYGQFATFGGAPNTTTVIGIGTGDRFTKSYSAFAQAQYKFTNQLSLIGGLRYTNEVSDVHKFQPAGRAALGIPALDISPHSSDNRLTGTAKLVFQPTDAVMLYASYARGFKASGFNTSPGSLTSIVAAPESVDSYEIGLRSEFLDRRLRVNLTGFYYDYTNLQRSTFVTPPGGGLPQVVFGNAGGLHSKGIEAEIVARPIRAISIGGTLGLTDAKFTNYIDTSNVNYLGLRPARTPKGTGSVYADATIPVSGKIEISARAEYLYRSSAFGTDDNNAARLIDPVHVTNASLSLRSADGGWSITGYARNLFNITYVEEVVPASGFVPGVGLSLGAPRTYGVTVRKRF